MTYESVLYNKTGQNDQTCEETFRKETHWYEFTFLLFFLIALFFFTVTALGFVRLKSALIFT